MPIYLLSKYVSSPPPPHHTEPVWVSPARIESNRIELNRHDMEYMYANHTAKTRAADPIFAFAIGTSAALVRIRRDQQEKHPERAGEIGYGDLLSTGTNRVRKWWAGEFTGVWIVNYLGLVWLFWGSLCGYLFMMSIVFVIPVYVGCPRFYTKARLLICKNFDVWFFRRIRTDFN